jgi:GPH family glycoside/pentoside/hexuronide:cation symporter
VSNVALAALFVTGIVPSSASWQIGGTAVPIGLCLFTALHGAYWLGNGIMLPIATAMMADVAEIHRLQTGENKDGGYSSIFSLAMRMAISFSLIASGYCLDIIGYKVPAGSEIVAQSPEAIRRLGFVTFIVGAAICLASLFAIRMYPITRARLEEMREARALESPVIAS